MWQVCRCVSNTKIRNLFLSFSCNTKPHKSLCSADPAVGKVQAQKLPKHVIYCLLALPMNVWLSQTGALIYKLLLWRQPKVWDVPVRVSDGCSTEEKMGGTVLSWNLSSSNPSGQDTWKLLLPGPPNSLGFCQIWEVVRSKQIEGGWDEGCLGSLIPTSELQNASHDWKQSSQGWFFDFHWGGPSMLQGMPLTYYPARHAAPSSFFCPLKLSGLNAGWGREILERTASVKSSQSAG